MNIVFMHGKDETYPIVSLDGSILIIENNEYDLVSLQKDEQEIINVMEDDRFIANIIIPPSKYEEIETDETDENERPIYKRIKNSLDLESITLNVWKKEIKLEKESEEK